MSVPSSSDLRYEDPTEEDDKHRRIGGWWFFGFAAVLLIVMAALVGGWTNGAPSDRTEVAGAATPTTLDAATRLRTTAAAHRAVVRVRKTQLDAAAKRAIAEKARKAAADKKAAEDKAKKAKAAEDEAKKAKDADAAAKWTAQQQERARVDAEWRAQQAAQTAPPASQPPPAAAPVGTGGGPGDAVTRQFFDLLNAERTNRGLAPLVWNEGLANTARGWSAHMANQGGLSHNGPLLTVIGQSVPGLLGAAENVGMGSNVPQVHGALMASASHRDNLLGNYNQVGIGVVQQGGLIWVTFDFALS